MKKLKIFALVAILSLVCLASAQAIPECICYGDVWYGGNQLTTYAVTSYSSPVNETANYTPASPFSPYFYFNGDSHWPTGTYYICITSGSYWYHTTVAHIYGSAVNLGSVTLNSGIHPKHRYSDE